MKKNDPSFSPDVVFVTKNAAVIDRVFVAVVVFDTEIETRHKVPACATKAALVKAIVRDLDRRMTEGGMIHDRAAELATFMRQFAKADVATYDDGGVEIAYHITTVTAH